MRSTPAWAEGTPRRAESSGFDLSAKVRYISARSEEIMASDTKKTETRRRRKRASVGRAQAKKRTRVGTPKFPIHPEKK